MGGKYSRPGNDEDDEDQDPFLKAVYKDYFCVFSDIFMLYENFYKIGHHLHHLHHLPMMKMMK